MTIGDSLRRSIDSWSRGVPLGVVVLRSPTSLLWVISVDPTMSESSPLYPQVRTARCRYNRRDVPRAVIGEEVDK
jgi:hypothetical protein